MRSILKQVFLNGVASVRPNLLLESSLKIKNNELVIDKRAYTLDKNYYCVGFGKAVIGMINQVEKLLQNHLVSGIVSVPEGSNKLVQTMPDLYPCQETSFKIFEGAARNMPDENSVKASIEITKLVKSLGENDVLLVLISGGGSALLSLPILPITLEEKVETIQLLTSRGATITELNCVRQNLSQVKGGKLAALAYPAQVIGLILSDIVNDPIDFIASGPTSYSQVSSLEAVNVLKKYAVFDKVSSNVLKVLSDTHERPPPDDFHLKLVQNVIIGNNTTALNACLHIAQKYFSPSVIVSHSVQGLVDSVATCYLELVKLICEQFLEKLSDEQFESSFQTVLENYNIVLLKMNLFKAVKQFKKSNPKYTKICLLMGGETTTIVKGNGSGGRNQELALNFGLKLKEFSSQTSWFKDFNVYLLSAGTDGIDGPTEAAGAITYSSQMDDAINQQLAPLKYLQNNDSHGFYSALNNGRDLVETGHTGTNVMDLHVLVIDADP